MEIFHKIHKVEGFVLRLLDVMGVLFCVVWAKRMIRKRFFGSRRKAVNKSRKSYSKRNLLEPLREGYDSDDEMSTDSDF